MRANRLRTIRRVQFHQRPQFNVGDIGELRSTHLRVVECSLQQFHFLPIVDTANQFKTWRGKRGRKIWLFLFHLIVRSDNPFSQGVEFDE